MFEVILSVLYVIGTVYFNSSWFTLIGGVVLLILILPGVYAMIFGAPYIRSSDIRVRGILELGKFKKGDKVVDLGCGDGKLMLAIAGKGVRNVIGYEISILTYLLAKFRCRGRARVLYGNFWKKDFRNVDVIVCFLLERPMQDFKKKIWTKLKKGARVISNDSQMKGVKSDDKEGKVYLYVKK